MLVSYYMEWLWKQVGNHPRLIWIYQITLWWYQHLKDWLERIRSFFLPSRHGVQLFYYHAYPNFGDHLNEDLMNYLHVDFQPSEISTANSLCIGSILDNILLTQSRTMTYSTPIHIFGSGFMMPQEDTSESLNRPVIFHAVRGRLTLKRCERMCGQPMPDVVLGDPGLLIPKLFPDIKPNPLYDVGIICHSRDIGSPILNNLKFSKKTVHYIDILLPTYEFVKAVSECRLVLSSAMHGLICADSLGIPNKWLMVTGQVEGSGYKFRDYYSIYAQSAQSPLKLSEQCLYDDDVERLIKAYAPVVNEVEAICAKLHDALQPIKQLC